jgi:hypothetical protein
MSAIGILLSSIDYPEDPTYDFNFYTISGVNQGPFVLTHHDPLQGAVLEDREHFHG